MDTENRYLLVEELNDNKREMLKKIFKINTENCYIVVALRRSEFDQIKGGLK